MSVFDWDPVKFDVGVAKMNADHKVLIDLMNALHARNAAGATKPELQGLIDRLATATQRHFTAEEAYMESLAFPGLRAHKLIHQKLLADFGRHAAQFAAGSGQLEKGFFDFLSLWLRSHICHLDTQYGQLARQRQAG
jgi:hemerythrin-like metal-binding protein